MAAALAGIVDDYRYRNNIDTTAVVIQQSAEKVTELLSDAVGGMSLAHALIFHRQCEKAGSQSKNTHPNEGRHI